MKPWLVAAQALAVALLLIGGYVVQRRGAVVVDSTTLCPAAGPVAVHAMLLDRSDPVTPLQAQRLRQVLDRAIEDAAVGERIDLYVLAGRHPGARPCRLALSAKV